MGAPELTSPRYQTVTVALQVRRMSPDPGPDAEQALTIFDAAAGLQKASGLRLRPSIWPRAQNPAYGE